MKFRTDIKVERAEFSLRPEQPMAMLGSCFADNISKRMRGSLWDASNPLGVLFNPLSIAAAIELTLFDEHAADTFADSLFTHDGISHSWLFDTSSSSAAGKDDAIRKFLSTKCRFEDMLERGNTLCVTFGTAFCYFLNASNGSDKTYKNNWADGFGHIVANCHKQPTAMFTRRRMSCNEISETWLGLANKLKNRFPKLKIIFTVSPVRHVRDGLAENSRSKATLLLAVDRLCSKLDFCHYFPAYEIVNDDLRDYRFYASDLVHPSDEAVEYIWEIFRDTYLDEAGLHFLKEGEAIARRAIHRPIMEIAERTAAFRAETIKLYEDFHKRFPDSLSLKLT